MIILDCPHCKMRIAITVEDVRRLIEKVKEFDQAMFSPENCNPPPVDPTLEVQGKLEPGDPDHEFLQGMGIRP